MNTCPKCGSPQASELTTSGFTLQKKAMWFGCGSHVLLDEPEKSLSRTNQCRDQEEINDLRRKVEEDADRIRELEEQIKVKEFLLNEAMKDLETEQAENRELYAMLGHIVDWSPELPYYMKDEYKVLFKNALAAARELLSKCSVKEGK